MSMESVLVFEFKLFDKYLLCNLIFSEECTSSVIGSPKCLCGIKLCKPGETCANGQCLAHPVCQCGIVDVLCQCGQRQCSEGQICVNGECLGICIFII